MQECCEKCINNFFCTKQDYDKVKECRIYREWRNEKKKIDPKTSGIPNINFSLVSKGDKREEKFFLERIKNGFDESETWSLYGTIANFIIPRLERYEEIAKDFLNRDKRLVKKIDTFLEALKLIARNNGSCNFNEEEDKIIDKGLK